MRSHQYVLHQHSSTKTAPTHPITDLRGCVPSVTSTGVTDSPHIAQNSMAAESGFSDDIRKQFLVIGRFQDLGVRSWGVLSDPKSLGFFLITLSKLEKIPMYLSGADFHATTAACKIEIKINPLLVFATPLDSVSHPHPVHEFSNHLTTSQILG